MWLKIGKNIFIAPYLYVFDLFAQLFFSFLAVKNFAWLNGTLDMHANWLRLHFDMFFMTADVTIKKQAEKISLISIITQINPKNTITLLRL